MYPPKHVTEDDANLETQLLRGQVEKKISVRKLWETEHYPDHAAFQFDADLRLRGTLGGCVKHCAELSSHQKEAQSGLTS